MKYKTIGILASWNLVCDEGQFFTLNTHYSYIEYVSTLYEKIYLVTSVRYAKASETDRMYCVSKYKNIEIIPLPEVTSSLQAVKLYKDFKKAVKDIIPKVDVVYCRVPDPFSWMPAILFKKKCIMHFVGDTIDATKHNEKWSWLKKGIMIVGYIPDYMLTLRAARKSRVYTNGHHLAQKLKRHHIQATPVVSSTVSQKDLHDDFKALPINYGILNITYIGYVRYAKGMKCLMDFCKRLMYENISFHFNLIGNGEMFEEVHSFMENEGLSKYVTMYGHIDDKQKMNDILRLSDLFFFPSLSEGSPRVVIEAMAQGTPVISTPVGSLPTTFKDGENISFFNYDDAETAVCIVKEYMQNPGLFDSQRKAAYRMVRDHFTKEKFLSNVFSYEA